MRRWAIPLAIVALGAVMIVIGSLVGGDYAPQVWLQLGAALALFGPLFWVQWMLEREITEARQEARQTHSSVERLSQDIEAIRQQTAASLDDLRSIALENVRRRRRADEDVFRRFRDELGFDSVAELIGRARDLGAITDRGVRVRLPGTTLRLRFPPSPQLGNGTAPALDVGLEEEDGTLPHDATAPGVAIRGQRPIVWSATQGAGEWAATVAQELQRLNRYPGDERFDPAGALEELMSLLQLAVEARTRPPSATAPMAPLRPVVEMPNDEWVITDDGIQSITSEAVFTVKDLFDPASADHAGARLSGDRAGKLREAWRLAQALFLSPGSQLPTGT
jgi:hypothetical protein